MPSYTLGELMSTATFNAGRRADLERSRVSFLVNEAYLEVWNVAHVESSERTATSSLVSGASRTSLPANCDALLSVSHSSGGYLTPLTQVQTEYLDSLGTAGGTPTYYAQYRGGIELRPVPNSAMTLELRYTLGCTDLVETSDVPSLSTPWRRAILLKAEEMVHHAAGNESGEVAASQRYFNYVSQLENDLAKRQKVGEYGVRVVY